MILKAENPKDLIKNFDQKRMSNQQGEDNSIFLHYQIR